MFTRHCVGGVLLVALAGIPSPATGAAEESKVSHVLPKDPQAAVIVLDYQGGFTPPRNNDDPAVLVRADGMVVLGAPYGQKKRVEARISPEDIQALLRFVLDEQQFGRFDPAKVKAAVEAEQRAAGRLIAVADAATTVIRVDADGRQKQVEYYALQIAANQFPKLKPLAQLLAIQERLERLRAEVYAGGPLGIARHLNLVNAELKAQKADAPPLTARDLQSAWQFANGTTYVSFARREKLDSGQARFTSANLNYPAEGPPKVTAKVSLAKQPR